MNGLFWSLGYTSIIGLLIKSLGIRKAPEFVVVSVTFLYFTNPANLEFSVVKPVFDAQEPIDQRTFASSFFY